MKFKAILTAALGSIKFGRKMSTEYNICKFTDGNTAPPIKPLNSDHANFGQSMAKNGIAG